MSHSIIPLSDPRGVPAQRVAWLSSFIRARFVIFTFSGIISVIADPRIAGLPASLRMRFAAGRRGAGESGSPGARSILKPPGPGIRPHRGSIGPGIRGP
jgi:hypothetical protein